MDYNLYPYINNYIRVMHPPIFNIHHHYHFSRQRCARCCRRHRAFGIEDGNDGDDGDVGGGGGSSSGPSSVKLSSILLYATSVLHRSFRVHPNALFTKGTMTSSTASQMTPSPLSSWRYSACLHDKIYVDKIYNTNRGKVITDSITSKA